MKILLSLTCLVLIQISQSENVHHEYHENAPQGYHENAQHVYHENVHHEYHENAQQEYHENVTKYYRTDSEDTTTVDATTTTTTTTTTTNSTVPVEEKSIADYFLNVNSFKLLVNLILNWASSNIVNFIFHSVLGLKQTPGLTQ